MVRLRAFEETDLPAAHRLDQLCFPPGIAYSLRELKHFVASANAYSIVAELTEGPAVMAGFLIADYTPRRQSASITTIDVMPEERRSGVGTLLMNAAETHLIGLGCNALTLKVAVNNQGAQSFYVRRGFTVVGRRKGYYNGVLDAFTMSKHLRASAG